MNYARVINNIAIDVSASPSTDFHPSLAAQFVSVPAQVQPQWRKVDGVWQAPPPPPEPEPTPVLTWENAPAEYWWISVGSFFDRFGAKALAITSSTDPVVMGMVTLTLPRKYVDLKRADLAAMMAMLVSKGMITEAEMTAVLTTATTEQERHVAGLPQPAE